MAVLHSWGGMRPWTLSGHFHESNSHDLIHIIEAFSGMPIDVEFIRFQDVLEGSIDKYKIIINARREGDAWSGGDVWKNERLITRLTDWAAAGGTFIGINEPSAVRGYDTYFRMAHILGVDMDIGERVCG